uniref:SAM-dependent MTase RsmB/NOP-type domain-containing protein n=2 Tax=Amorphochlora amoebiformis TaxID=1561963 RepID=A0A7S0CSR6_9EUKA|mmetsp:Transcript_12936/g.20467  ORF Transcript_12936/g.20467 Transcript_12936/m.20467 type:complete len:431 (+) Transcript_12936:114-1406(+)
MPRYCRVNLIITTVEAVVKKLEDSGFEEVEASESAPEGKSFFRDRQVPGVLVFAPRTDLHDHLLVVSGALVLQDKSSCFPAHALSPSPTWDCIDACAAPGNKTSHLIAIIHSRLANNELAQDCSSIPAPTVTAFERDAGRAKLLGRRLEKMGVCPNVKGAGGWKGKEWRGATDGGRVLVCVRKGSFLDAKPQDYPNVRAIVVDPTCSGSGMVGRVDHLLRETEPLFPASSTSSTTYNGKNMGGKKRKRGVNPTSESSKEVVSKVESIAAFQKKIVSHALSFPSVQIVAYSTCSIHNEENEEVVRFALKDNPDFRLKRALPAWKRRGAEGMESCVRVDPIQDLTTGFFVALFERHRTSRTAVNKTSVTKTSQPLNHVVSRRNQISSSMSAKREVGDAKKLGAGGGTVCAPSGGRGRKRRKKRPVRVKLMKF